MSHAIGWKKTSKDLFERVAELEAALSNKADAYEQANNERCKLTAENTRLRAALDATWDALDGLYGADIGEEIPVNLLPKDRRRLFDRALEMVGSALAVREET